MKMGRRTITSICCGAVTTASLVGLPGGASAATTLGANPNGEFCVGSPSTYVQRNSDTPTYTAPSSGVITSWNYQVPSNPPTAIKLRILRRVPTTENFTTIGQSQSIAPLANQPNTSPTRISVQAGDLLGVTATDPDVFSCGSFGLGAAASFFEGDPATGSTDTFGSLSGDVQLNISARLESDVDGDGFGDETQDLCPSSAATQLTCAGQGGGGDTTAPETEIAKKPKAKTRQKRAFIEFSASEAGASFECSLDGSAYAGCESPFIKTVSKGKHSFKVRAVDAAGNKDASPASAVWTVKKPKKKGKGGRK